MTRIPIVTLIITWIMHPVIRIACFILLIINTTKFGVLVWLLIALLLFVLYRIDNSLTSTLPVLKRLRWLFLSIFVLHVWFSAPEFMWMPPWTGWIQALQRVGALIFIVLTAHLLLRTTPKSDIIAALQWWFQPLNQLGLSTQRLAVRLVLVLETVDAAQELYLVQQSVARESRYSLQTISQRAAALLNQVVMRAEHAPLQCLEIPDLLSPPLWQWVYVGILGLIWMV